MNLSEVSAYVQDIDFYNQTYEKHGLPWKMSIRRRRPILIFYIIIDSGFHSNGMNKPKRHHTVFEGESPQDVHKITMRLYADKRVNEAKTLSDFNPTDPMACLRLGWSKRI